MFKRHKFFSYRILGFLIFIHGNEPGSSNGMCSYFGKVEIYKYGRIEYQAVRNSGLNITSAIMYVFLLSVLVYF